MTRVNWFDWTALVVMVIGGLNWGLVGFFSFNLITAIFGAGTFSAVLFAIIGLASLYSIYSLSKIGTMTSMRGMQTEKEDIRRAA